MSVSSQLLLSLPLHLSEIAGFVLETFADHSKNRSAVNGYMTRLPLKLVNSKFVSLTVSEPPKCINCL